jgi:hypothetical protein
MEPDSKLLLVIDVGTRMLALHAHATGYATLQFTLGDDSVYVIIKEETPERTAMLFITRIPTHRNDGTPISDAELEDIKRQIWEAFGGLSLDGPGSGVWVADDGTIYEEASYMVQVHCDRSQYHEARALVVSIGRQLGQRAMYFEVRYFDGVEIIDIPDVDAPA